MSSVAIRKVEDGDLNSQPFFEQIEKRLEDVRRRAFELFESRGCESGRELEDWLTAEREVLGWPVLETQENDKQYEFQVALAGFDAKDVEVAASPNEIIVHAQTKAGKETEEASVKWTDFAASDVYRRIEVPQPIKVARIKATLDSGTLRITVPKAASNEKSATTA
jgi:HSP20 family molecular chaperone IbpA